MDNKTKLVAILSELKFDEKYYGFYEKIRHRSEKPGFVRKHWDVAIAATGLTFKFNAREKFYSHIEVTPHGSLELKLAFRYDTLEGLLYLRRDGNIIGGTFHGLAFEAGKLKHPGFAPDPPYPKLPFSNSSELLDAVSFVTGLYEAVRPAILSFSEWDQ